MKHLTWKTPLGEVTWWHLRSIGELRVLKTAYISFLLIPYVEQLRPILSNMGVHVWAFGAMCLCFFFLALGGLVYDTRCPQIVKRFASPNDMYERMLRIKELSIQYDRDSSFLSTHEHCERSYTNASYERMWWRHLCILFYSLAVMFFITVVANRMKYAIDMFLEALGDNA